MEIIKEPLNVDFVVENRPLTSEEEKQISDYIKSHKSKTTDNSKSKRTTSTSRLKV